MNRTASELPELHSDLPGLRPGSLSPRVFISGELGERSRAFNFLAFLRGGLIGGPGKPTEHGALQEWNREELPGWGNLDATGATTMITATGVPIIVPVGYRHLTTHHLAIGAVPVELRETMDELDDLRELLPGWNGYDVDAPSLTAIEAAKPWVQMFYREALEAAGRWITPHVTADETGEVMFEWSNGHKALTAYVSEDEVILARDWGPNIETEMESAVDPQTELRREWWAWLTG